MQAPTTPHRVSLDVHGRASLDGVWEFLPAPYELHELDGAETEPIVVPGLWEAQGHLELDGVCWYRRHFDLDDAVGCWTLRFGAVMDFAEVYLNGQHLGGHEHPFTPFEFDVTNALRAGGNVLLVRVYDPSLDDPEHIRSAHGKQGWANHVFPSRPSLYLTYGGIWQSVTLRRHGPVVVGDVFVNADPDNLRATVEVTNRGVDPVTARVAMRAVGLVDEQTVQLPPGGTDVLTWHAGATGGARWSPATPVLHDLIVDVVVDSILSDHRTERFGLRTVHLDGDRMFVNGEPYRMKSILVQGFAAEELYAEGSREEIEAEVRAAQAMGFNMLRLHIKAFDPRYLDVCDELGILLECDLPIAEPIAHDELGDGTELSRRAVGAITEQVRRDRNHPSIVLWSAMNELGLDREGVRETDVYEQFARTLYAAVVALDDTRPVIENEWVEPDPERVFCSPILTAHWYGRLHAEYLNELEDKTRGWAGLGRPLFVSEFGDWGLPDMPERAEAPFWDPREVYAAGLAMSRWPSSMAHFIAETQRYQGISDRLQTETFRRHDHIGGYCLTELTDVPHELNGLLDLHRRPKPIAVAEVTRANQVRLPMLHLDTLLVVAGDPVTGRLHVANDGGPVDDVEVWTRFSDAVGVAVDRLAAFDVEDLPVDDLAERFTESVAANRIGHLPGHHTRCVGEVTVAAPRVPGNHDLLLELRIAGEVVARNRYPIHVVPLPAAPYPLRVRGAARTAEVLRGLGADVGERGPLVVGEGALDATVAAEVGHALATGETVIMLVQEPPAAPHYPVPTVLAHVETAWGSSVFHFTTDAGAIPSLPRRNLLVGEDSTVQARHVITRIGGADFPDEPVVIAYKPMPGALTGTLVGAHGVGPGRLILCQYRLEDAAARGDAAARALLADLAKWAADPRPPTTRHTVTKDDGRSLTFYRFDADGER